MGYHQASWEQNVRSMKRRLQFFMDLRFFILPVWNRSKTGPAIKDWSWSLVLWQGIRVLRRNLDPSKIVLPFKSSSTEKFLLIEIWFWFRYTWVGNRFWLRKRAFWQPGRWCIEGISQVNSFRNEDHTPPRRTSHNSGCPLLEIPKGRTWLNPTRVVIAGASWLWSVLGWESIKLRKILNRPLWYHYEHSASQPAAIWGMMLGTMQQKNIYCWVFTKHYALWSAESSPKLHFDPSFPHV